jgi:hypothetical protein
MSKKKKVKPPTVEEAAAAIQSDLMTKAMEPPASLRVKQILKEFSDRKGSDTILIATSDGKQINYQYYYARGISEIVSIMNFLERKLNKDLDSQELASQQPVPVVNGAQPNA